MKAIDHYRHSRIYTILAHQQHDEQAKAANALLAVAEAAQGLLMLMAVGEPQDTHYYSEWRNEWQSDPPPTREG